MTATASGDSAYAPTRPPWRAPSLAHLPGNRGLPMVGHSLAFLRDPLNFARDRHARFGPVSRVSFLFRERACLLSAEANELVLRDRDGIFSAHHGWTPILGDLFPLGLMLRDGGDHRLHRRLMQPAFRAEALAGYLRRMHPHIDAAVAEWGQQGGLRFYPAIKRLTLAIAADCFLGLSLQHEIDAVNTAFSDVVEASAAVVRAPVVGRKYARGLHGRAYLESFIRQRIPERRDSEGDDLFSQLCHARDEQGQRYSDEDIINHIIFLMMAAHDTTTSALTTIVYALAAHPEWQQRLRADGARIGSGPLAHEAMDEAQLTGMVLREALRLYPPLTTIVRESTQDCELHGHRIPAGTSVSVFPVFTQRDPRHWSAPDSFDPERFGSERAEHRNHPFAWVPFGGGAHTCLGLHFAEMQVKAVMHSVLQQLEWEVPEGYVMPYQLAPIARPKDGLPLKMRAL